VRQAVDALSVKAGQLCTNIRRILVPDHHASVFAETVRAEVEKLVVGDPALPEVTLGPLVDERQRRAAIDGLARLTAEARPICGGGAPQSVNGADPSKGAFLAPTLLAAPSGEGLSAVHKLEVFGPVATLIPYRTREEAVAMVARAGGSLAASVYCEDPAVGAALALEIAPTHGRVLTIDPVVGKDHTGHAIVMPQCVHGGPGRAGGGEELGGTRGLRFYMQRTALQGSPAMLDAVGTLAAKAAM
jgi:3,4-dehydroadipyl-CoA semialdehyde dehydrogenase